MSWSANEKLRAAILTRLGILLGSKTPDKVLAFMVRRESLAHKELCLERDYSVLEDLVVQSLIMKFKDHKLDLLWNYYNVGYFQEDTETYLKSKLGENYERFINNLADDHLFALRGKRVPAA